MLEKYNDYLTVSDIIEILPISRLTVYKLIKSSELKAFKVGKKNLIPKKELIRFIKNS